MCRVESGSASSPDAENSPGHLHGIFHRMDFEHLTDIHMLCLRVLSATWKNPCLEEETYGKAHRGLGISPLPR